MIFSKDIVDNILKFMVANIETLLQSAETDYTATIDRAVHFDTVLYSDMAMPFVLLYEKNTTHEMETLQRDKKLFQFVLFIKDSRADLNRLRVNLYGYRDAIENLIEFNSELGNSGGVALISDINMPPVIYDNVNYTGAIEIRFRFETV